MIQKYLEDLLESASNPLDLYLELNEMKQIQNMYLSEILT